MNRKISIQFWHRVWCISCAFPEESGFYRWATGKLNQAFNMPEPESVRTELGPKP